LFTGLVILENSRRGKASGKGKDRKGPSMKITRKRKSRLSGSKKTTKPKKKQKTPNGIPSLRVRNDRRSSKKIILKWITETRKR